MYIHTALFRAVTCPRKDELSYFSRMTSSHRREVHTGMSIRVSLSEKQTRRGSRTAFTVLKSQPNKKSSTNVEVTSRGPPTALSFDFTGAGQGDHAFYDDGFISVPPNQKKKKGTCFDLINQQAHHAEL